MSEAFTCVEVAFYPEYLNWWLRFGLPDVQQDLDRRRSLALFRPGRVFGYVRWCANDYGTRDWRITVVRTVESLQLLSRVEGVHPGGEVLLLAAGSTRVRRVLLQIDALEAAGFDPAEVSLAYLRHLHNRIATTHSLAAYSKAQHAAFLAGKAVAR